MDDLTELRRLTDETKKLAEADDRPALRRLARQLWVEFEVQLISRRSMEPAVRQIVTELDTIYDAAFPVFDRINPYHLMDAPWPTGPRESQLRRDTVVRVLDALYAARALDAEVVEAVFLRDRRIGNSIRVRKTAGGALDTEPARCAGLVHDITDEMI